MPWELFLCRETKSKACIPLHIGNADGETVIQIQEVWLASQLRSTAPPG